MNGLREKFRKHEGFTLVEMLIVVAIIAILIAISIPLINNALERAKHSTDAANERSAKAEILIQWISDGGMEINAGTTYIYDAAKGSLKTLNEVNVNKNVTPYGKHTATKGTNSDHADKFIAVSVDKYGVVSMQWINQANVTIITTPNNQGLCSDTSVDHT